MGSETTGPAGNMWAWPVCVVGVCRVSVVIWIENILHARLVMMVVIIKQKMALAMSRYSVVIWAMATAALDAWEVSRSVAIV